MFRLLARADWLEAYYKRLPKAVLRRTRDAFREDPDVDKDEVADRVVRELELQPLELGDLHRVTMEVSESEHLSPYLVRFDAFRCTAVVPL